MDDPALTALIDGFDTFIDDGLFRLSDEAGFLFDAVRAGLDALYGAVHALLILPPFWAVALIVGAGCWRAGGPVFGALAALGFGFCALMGLWPRTMETLALVIAAMLIALAIAIPLGVIVGGAPRLDRVMQPALDLVQTMPPYIYLLPCIALLGYGPAAALTATVIVAIPPALRLTALGIRNTPEAFLELGRATGMTGLRIFVQIRLPFARRSIMAGVNQSLMMAFGMVVIAGIVGSGGLGQTIYDAVRTLDIARSVDGAIAIVILTMTLDRLTQAAATERR